MKRNLVITAVVFVLFVVSVLFAVAMLMPSAPVKAYMASVVKDKMGRELDIAGPVSTRLVPRFTMRAENVTLGNEPGVTGEPPATAKAVEIAADILPTITWEGWLPGWKWEPSVERVRLIEPKIALVFDKQGRSNLALGSGSGGASGPAIMIRELSAVGATVSYRDERSGDALSAERVEVTARDVDVAALTTGGVSVRAGALDVRGAKEAGTAALKEIVASIKGYGAGRASEIALQSAGVEVRHPPSGRSVAISRLELSSAQASLQSVSGLALSGGQLSYRDQAGGLALTGRDVLANIKELAGGRITGLTARGGSIGLEDASTRGGGLSVEQVVLVAPSVAIGEPLAGDLEFVWNRDKVTGAVRLPAGWDAAAAGATLPVVASLSAAKGRLDWDGQVALGQKLQAKGKTRASTASLSALAQWLGQSLPSSKIGAAAYEGELEVLDKEVRLGGGKLTVDGNAATGTATLSLAGAKPFIKAALAADSFDAGVLIDVPQPTRSRAATRSPPQRAPEPDPVRESLKAYLAAMLDIPVTRSGDDLSEAEVPFEALERRTTRSREPDADDWDWSNDKLDLAFLRTFDADIELSVKSLAVGDLKLGFEKLKADVRDGALSLDAQNLALAGGRITGKVTVDARQSIPHIATSFVADGAQTTELMEALGVPGATRGNYRVEADLTGTGSSQRELVSTLSGAVKARMGQGAIVGYDAYRALDYINGRRTYDPDMQTPFNRLTADVQLDNGVTRESTLELDGSILGITGEGWTKLPTRQLDYSTRIKLPIWFRAIPTRIAGAWNRIKVTYDWGNFFRSPTTVESPLVVLEEKDLTDPELADMLGRVIERAGSRGLPGPVLDTFRTLQQRAQGQRP